MVFPNSQWLKKDDDRKVNVQEEKRYNTKFEIALLFLHENFGISLNELYDSGYKRTLRSVSGQELPGSKSKLLFLFSSLIKRLV